ncbi:MULTISPECIES: response regulator transcription factor [Cysteiniphilum]|uniref:DNA-binding response regulator n=1 Tax=Cysteiniphilum litorale TaxID=2056700 RepID=A0A8J3E8V1_9GAMM|nr:MULTISPECIES: response regulator transcription factor [Cysteiniphilum]GGG01969.1 DNA-binding response regulator [Cysteiniphilum litorale]
MNKKILLIDDEAQIRKFLKKTLLVLGYDVYDAVSAEHATEILNQQHPDLILLDLGLPDQDGQKWLANLRVKHLHVPVIVVSARCDGDEVVKALENGANDYVRKPFDMSELVARIKRNLELVDAFKAEDKAAESVYQFENMRVHIADHRVMINDEVVHLSKKEFLLLSVFCQNAGKLLTQNQILQQIWGEYFADEVQYLRVYVGQLRKKLAACSKQPLITTESGVGYRFAKVDVYQ